MSKASEFAAQVKARPQTTISGRSFGVDADGNLRIGENCIHVNVRILAKDVPTLIKWLKETFED